MRSVGTPFVGFLDVSSALMMLSYIHRAATYVHVNVYGLRTLRVERIWLLGTDFITWFASKVLPGFDINSSFLNLWMLGIHKRSKLSFKTVSAPSRHNQHTIYVGL